MLRLFAGLSLPDDIAKALLLKQGGLNVNRWQPQENLHITLRFLDDVSEDQAEDLDALLAMIDIPSFDLQLTGFGYFGDEKRVRILHATVSTDPALLSLQHKVIAAARQVGINLKRAKYHPHVTLARNIKDPVFVVEDWIAAQGSWKSDVFTVTGFHLYSSQLTDKGSKYFIEADYALS